MNQRFHRSLQLGAAWLVLSVIALCPPSLCGQAVTLEALQRDGYGVVKLARPRPNVLIAIAEVDGRKQALLLHSAWEGEGIGLHNPASAAPAASGPSDRLTLGNVQLLKVPVSRVNMDAVYDQLPRRVTGATGVVGAPFLRACSAIIDLQNLRMYLRPPGHGRSVALGAAMQGLGLAEAPLEAAGGKRLLADVEINGVPGKMFVDTGAYLAAADIRLTQQLGAHPIVTRAGYPRPETQDEFKHIERMDSDRDEWKGLVTNSPMTPLRSFKISGVPVRAPDLRLRRFDFYQPSGGKTIGRLGMDILGGNGAIIDFGQQRLYFLKGK